MITLRPSQERGHFDFGWLNTYHSFSFGDYQDPAHDHFRALRVINEDWIHPGQGFGMHGHRDMEILTWVLEGALEHRDSLGNGGVIRPGDAQRMSAGTGIQHSEFNASGSEPVHLLQIWLLPESSGFPPSYEQRHFPAPERLNRLRLLASRDGRDRSVSWHQEADLYASLLHAGSHLEPTMLEGRHAWIQVACGHLLLNKVGLGPGDGAAVSGEKSLRLEAIDDAEVLVFDLV